VSAAVPKDRPKLVLVIDYSINEKVTLQSYYQKLFSKSKIVKYDKIDAYADRNVDEYDVRTPNIQTKARSLSGGNQQKVMIGREVDRSPDLFIAALPTRGLAGGAIELIHRKLVEDRDK